MISFERFFTESPDRVITGKKLLYYNSRGARPFGIYNKDLILAGLESYLTHSDIRTTTMGFLQMVIDDIEQSPTPVNGWVFIAQNSIALSANITGRRAVEFLETLKQYDREYDDNLTNSETGINSVSTASEVNVSTPYRDKAVEGRIWAQDEIISLWNNKQHFDSMTGSRAGVQSVCRLLNVDYNNLTWDFEADKMQIKTSELDSAKAVASRDLDRPIHMLPPEQKGDIMKQMGIRPKLNPKREWEREAF